MKSIIFTFSLFFLTLYCQAQKKYLEIDVESNIYKNSTIKKSGEYTVKLLNYDSSKIYEVDINKEYHKYEPLTIPKTDTTQTESLSSSNTKIIDVINLSKNQDLSIKIVVYTKKKEDKKESIIKEKEYNYTYKTERKGTWQTTFGFNFIALSDKDSYFSKQMDSTYAITKGTNQNKIDFHPSVMFTWLTNNSKDFNFGITGGLGYDLEKSLSVFTGISVIYNQNITISAGAAFHNQKLLNSQYKEDDILKENLTFDQLHKDYIRFNPFISISFRLDKSPF